MSFRDPKSKTELDERYSRLRTIINRKFSIEDVFLRYDPSVKNHPKSIISILNVDDSNPSLFINYYKNVWKCFSTGKGGGYLELIYWIKVLREQEQNVNIHKLANSILITDKEIQKEFGATSLFKQSLPKTIDLRLRDNQVSPVGIKTITEVITTLANRQDKSLFYKMISDFELGTPVNELVEKYGLYDSNDKPNSESKKLEDLITNLFGGDNKDV